jgi:hypothetical protein
MKTIFKRFHREKNAIIQPTVIEATPPKLTIYVPDGNHETRFVNLLKTQSLLDTKDLFQNSKPVHNHILPSFIHEFFLTDNDFQLHKALANIESKTILLDFSTEAITFFPLDNIFSKKMAIMHEYIAKNNFQNNEIILLNANSVANLYYDNWRNSLGIKTQIKIVGYDFYLLEFTLALSKKLNEKNYFPAILEDAATTITQNKLRPRHFSCLNNKFKAHRYAVALQLFHLGLLEQSDISFFPPTNDDLDSFDNSEKFLAKLANGNILLDTTRHFNQHLPLIVDRTKNIIEKDVYISPDAPDYWEAILGITPVTNKTFLNNSYIDLVNETWFTDASCQFITEKTLRPLATLKPFIHIGTPYVLRKLHSLGFQTFAPFIDETYDLIGDPVARMDAIQNEIARLGALSTVQLHETYRQLWPRLVHNYFHLLRENNVWLTELLANLCGSINFKSQHSVS